MKPTADGARELQRRAQKKLKNPASDSNSGMLPFDQIRQQLLLVFHGSSFPSFTVLGKLTDETKRALAISPTTTAFLEKNTDLCVLSDYSFRSPVCLLTFAELIILLRPNDSEGLLKILKRITDCRQPGTVFTLLDAFSSWRDSVEKLPIEYQITQDNFTKMCLILLRIRARVPVVVMGETGCGKTSCAREW